VFTSAWANTDPSERKDKPKVVMTDVEENETDKKPDTTPASKQEETSKKSDPSTSGEFEDQDSTSNSLNKYNFIFYFIYKYKYESPGESFRKLFE
jgi:hypothetical protein